MPAEPWQPTPSPAAAPGMTGPLGPFGTRLMAALRLGWPPALIAAVQTYVLLAVVGTALAGGVLGLLFEPSVATVLRAGAAAGAMAFRGGFNVSGATWFDDGGAGVTVIAAPLMVLAVALAGVFFFSRRAGRQASTDAEAAWPLALRITLAFTALNGIAGALARTDNSLLGSDDLTFSIGVLRTVLGTALIALPFALLGVLRGQQRMATLRSSVGERLGVWRRPLLAMAATISGQLVAAMFGMGLYGCVELLRADGPWKERLAAGIAGLAYLPNLAVAALGFVNGANLEMRNLGDGSSTDSFGWFATDKPDLWWLVGTAVALAIAVRAAVWLGRRSAADAPAWIARFAVAVSAGFTGCALLARVSVRFHGSGLDIEAGSIGLALVHVALAGLAIGLVAGFLGQALVRRSGVIDDADESQSDFAALAEVRATLARRRKAILAGTMAAVVLTGAGIGAYRVLNPPPPPFTMRGTLTVSPSNLSDSTGMGAVVAAYRAQNAEATRDMPSYEPTRPTRPTEPTDDTWYLTKPTPPTKSTNWYTKPSRSSYPVSLYGSSAESLYQSALETYNEYQAEIDKQYREDLADYNDELADYNKSKASYNAEYAQYQKDLASYQTRLTEFEADTARWEALQRSAVAAAVAGLTADCPSLGYPYSDIYSGADLDVMDEDGEILATAPISGGRLHLDAAGSWTCTFDFSAEIPERGTYQLRPGSQSGWTFSKEQVKDRHVELTLG